jgi:hypothetical protein
VTRVCTNTYRTMFRSQNTIVTIAFGDIHAYDRLALRTDAVVPNTGPRYIRMSPGLGPFALRTKRQHNGGYDAAHLRSNSRGVRDEVVQFPVDLRSTSEEP